MSRHPQEPRVAVVLPTLNGEKFIGAQLEALYEQVLDEPWHLVVVDSGSTDSTLEIVDSFHPSPAPTRVVQLGRPLGVNAAMNAGVIATSSEIVLLADHDDVVRRGWMQAIVSALDNHWLAGSHLDRFTLNDPEVVGSRRHFAEDVDFQVPIATTTGMGFRRVLWESLGGFDESYLYGCNDGEFCFRASDIGHPVHLVDNAIVHYRIRSSASDSFRQSRAYGEQTVRLYREFGPAYLKRRRATTIARDIARLVFWAARCSLDRSYLHRLAFRGGLQLGYIRGSISYRTLFL